MVTSCRAYWVLSLALTAVLVSACSKEPDDFCSIPDDAPLEVGFAAVDIPWRAGAKPGQVGTGESGGLAGLYAKLLSGALPILNPPGLTCEAPPYDDCDVGTCSCEPEFPREMLNGITDWALEELEERVAAVTPGKYNDAFLPGDGVELPPDVKVTVIRRGCEKVALVRGDLYIMHDQLRRRVAALVEAETGLTRDRIFLAATHNHSTPHTISSAPGVWVFADSFDPRQFVYVSRKIAEAIIAADKELRPATLRVAQTEMHGIAHNIIGPGRMQMDRAPDAVRSVAPAGASGEINVGYPYAHIDPALTVLRFDDAESGAPISFIFVFGMHPESLKERHGITSGEWPRHVEEKVLRRTGIRSMWLPGSLGDSEPDKAKVSEHNFMRETFETMDLMTDLIFENVRDLFDSAGETTADPFPALRQLSRDIPGPKGFPIPTSSYLAQELPFLGRLPFIRVTHDTATFPLHLVRIGDALLVGVPAEVTTDLSLNIKSRIDREAGVYQGYVWDSAPEWVRGQVARNFSIDEVAPEEGVKYPVLVNHTNAWIGYIVSRWEHMTRAHYRESLTAYGPDTANHVAENVLGLYRHMIGKGRHELDYGRLHELDLEGVKRIETYLAGLEDRVATMSRNLPPSDPAEVGTVLAEPEAQVVAGEDVLFTWTGGTNDLDLPRVIVEEQRDTEWEEIARGPTGEVFILFQPPDQWTARWKRVAGTGNPARIRVEGEFRGSTPGASTPDPLWDPEGANQSYSVTSRTFVVADPG